MITISQSIKSEIKEVIELFYVHVIANLKKKIKIFFIGYNKLFLAINLNSFIE